MFEFVADVFSQVICLMTGHAVLWLLTLGRWNISNRRGEVATIVGILFWVILGVAVWLVFFR